MSKFNENKVVNDRNDNNKSKKYGTRNSNSSKRRSMKGKQGRKDSDAKRINFDNERVSKFVADMEDKSNDVSWYTKFQQLMNAAASISYYGNAGEWLPFRNGTQTIPGIMTFDYHSFLFADGGEAINQTANSNYSFTVHGNSRNTKYNAPDQMLLKLGGKDIFCYLALGLRVYGTMMNYEQLNYYTPRALVQAQGFNFEDLNAQLSSMLFDLNDMIAQTHQIWLPNDMPLVARQFWMNTNIYEDGESIKSQYYFYRPASFLLYDETSLSSGGMLRPLKAGDVLTATQLSQYHISSGDMFAPASFVSWDPDEGGMTWEIYKAGFKALISHLLNSEDRGIIYGDILKAYGAGSLYTITEITSAYKTIPVPKHAEVLSQFENMTVNDVIPTGIAQNPDSNTLVPFHYAIAEDDSSADAYFNPVNYMGKISLLNFHGASFPTPEQLIVATRCTALGGEATPMYYWEASNSSLTWPTTDEGTGSVPFVPIAAGTEIVCAITIYGFGSSTDDTHIGSRRILTDVQWRGGKLSTEFINKWTAFDWAPALYYLNSSDDPSIPELQSSPEKYDVIMEVDNFTTVDAYVMRKVHKAALYSLLGMLES